MFKSDIQVDIKTSDQSIDRLDGKESRPSKSRMGENLTYGLMRGSRAEKEMAKLSLFLFQFSTLNICYGDEVKIEKHQLTIDFLEQF
ncbi:hypothetical protein [Bacillus pseudomycoides]|uniref:hypothetical protein n=2 Tax=Bacillus pseudomycoides TaxID=64104 RepID=UPI0005352F6D|nr:hypothetical protein [Bacillus pseudomycoides]MDR4188731.1 hypothetical protein [Bacillus pseudomycoides]MED0853607.1 hypothetical protein [Bacillus pseudomycoides]PGC44258.1 hypothetical protein COM18_00010 [Bacillus pseudomycoides]